MLWHILSNLDVACKIMELSELTQFITHKVLHCRMKIYSSDTARVQLGYSLDTAQIQLGYSSDTARIQLGYSSDTARIQLHRMY